MRRKIVFKTHAQDQLSLLSQSYNDLVPWNHLVRIVNTIIDHVNISNYKGGGGDSSYHLRILLKFIIYAYIQNCKCSSKKLEELA